MDCVNNGLIGKTKESCPVRLGEFEKFSYQKMQDYLNSVHFFSYSSSSRSVLDFKDLQPLYPSIFMKTISLELTSDKKFIDLKLNRINKGFFEDKKLFQKEEYSLRFIHNHNKCFRILMCRGDGDEEELKFWLDVWLDEKLFEENFKVCARSPIRAFFQELLLMEEENPEKMDFADSEVELKSPDNCYYLKQLTRKIIDRLEEALEQKKYRMSEIYSKNCYMIAMPHEQDWEFCFVGENPGSQSIELVRLVKNIGFQMAEQR